MRTETKVNGKITKVEITEDNGNFTVIELLDEVYKVSYSMNTGEAKTIYKPTLKKAEKFIHELFSPPKEKKSWFKNPFSFKKKEYQISEREIGNMVNFIKENVK